MDPRDEFVEEIEAYRALIRSGKHDKCTCHKTWCEWHGNCYECVLIHRATQDHIPNCLQPMLRKQVKALARIAEYEVEGKKGSPVEYWDYLKQVSPKDQS